VSRSTRLNAGQKGLQGQFCSVSNFIILHSMTRSDSEQRAPPRRLLALGEIVGDRAISPIGGKMLREVIELDGGSFLWLCVSRKCNLPIMRRRRRKRSMMAAKLVNLSSHGHRKSAADVKPIEEAPRAWPPPARPVGVVLAEAMSGDADPRYSAHWREALREETDRRIADEQRRIADEARAHRAGEARLRVVANATALEIPVWETRRAHPAVPSRSFGRRGNWQSAAINNLPEPAVGSPPARRATPVTRLPPTRRVEVRFRGTAEMEGRAVSTEHSAFDPMYPFRKHRKLGRFIANCQRDVPCSPRGNWQRFMPPAGVTLSANPHFCCLPTITLVCAYTTWLSPTSRP
jgi:hypothetical protein